MKTDITNKDDVKLLVDTFYNKVNSNSILEPIFNNIVKIDWEKHLPIMYTFWGNILLGEHNYSGNPMEKHLQLSKQTNMTAIEFSEWIQLFTQTTDELFEGAKAEEAKTKATNIAQLMLSKIQAQASN